MNKLEDLKKQLAIFNKERDWRQFHSPKNLSMALSVEASEIVEIFQWMKEDDSLNPGEEKIAKLKEEIGDVFLYLLLLSEKFGVDPIDAALDKLNLNKEKYPVASSKGNSKKYKDL